MFTIAHEFFPKIHKKTRGSCQSEQFFFRSEPNDDPQRPNPLYFSPLRTHIPLPSQHPAFLRVEGGENLTPLPRPPMFTSLPRSFFLSYLQRLLNHLSDSPFCVKIFLKIQLVEPLKTLSSYNLSSFPCLNN